MPRGSTPHSAHQSVLLGRFFIKNIDINFILIARALMIFRSVMELSICIILQKFVAIIHLSLMHRPICFQSTK